MAFRLAALLVAAPVLAQEPTTSPPQTRAEAIADERSAKVAELWPERQSPMVDRINALAERGLREGLDSGRGANGAQLVFGGMRSGQGFSGGIGYRRSDFWQERLGYRVTARGTPSMAPTCSTSISTSRGCEPNARSCSGTRSSSTRRGSTTTASATSRPQENLTGYLYDDFTSDFNAAFEPARFLRLGVTGGYLWRTPHGQGSEELPPIDEVFPAESAARIRRGHASTRASACSPSWIRVIPGRVQRSGLLLGARYRGVPGTWTKDVRLPPDRVRVPAVPAVLQRQPRRGAACGGSAVVPQGRQRRAVVLSSRRSAATTTCAATRGTAFATPLLYLGVEHRWHVSSILDMAVFADAGKVVPLKREVDFDALHYSGGIGFRVRLRSAVVTRIDFAAFAAKGSGGCGRSAMSTSRPGGSHAIPRPA